MRKIAILLLATLLLSLTFVTSPALAKHRKNMAYKGYRGTVTKVSKRAFILKYKNRKAKFLVGSFTRVIKSKRRKPLSILNAGDKILVKSVKSRTRYPKAKKIYMLKDVGKKYIFKGTITAIDSSSVELHIKQSKKEYVGKTMRFLVGKFTRVIKNGEKSLADLEVGDYVLIKSKLLNDSSFKALKIIVFKDGGKEEEKEYDHEFKGIVASISPDYMLVTIEEGEGCLKDAVGITIGVVLNKETEVMINESKGSLNDIAIGNRVKVLAKYNTISENKGELVAKKIFKLSENT